jgi:DNA-binding GntR family transcriptional regulator
VLVCGPVAWDRYSLPYYCRTGSLAKGEPVRGLRIARLDFLPARAGWECPAFQRLGEHFCPYPREAGGDVSPLCYLGGLDKMLVKVIHVLDHPAVLTAAHAGKVEEREVLDNFAQAHPARMWAHWYVSSSYNYLQRKKVPLPGEALLEPEDVRTAPTEVYATLRFQIAGGEIPPGTHININAVARNLGVSQTPVREALQKLEGDGLLVYRAARGYATTPILDLKGLRSLFEFRLLVEPWAARSAAVDSLSNPSGTLKEELDEFQRRVDGRGEVRHETLEHDARFHNVIIAASGNSVVGQAYAQTHCHLHVFRLYPVDIEGTATLEEHRDVWKAIHDCQPDEAERLMAKHIMASFERSARAFSTTSMLEKLLGGTDRRRPSMVG